MNLTTNLIVRRTGTATTPTNCRSEGHGYVVRSAGMADSWHTTILGARIEAAHRSRATSSSWALPTCVVAVNPDGSLGQEVSAGRQIATHHGLATAA